MDSFKIENFRRENPNAEFPWFRQLSAEESAAIRTRLARRMGVQPSCPPLALVMKLQEVALIVNRFDVHDVTFDLGMVFEKQRIKQSDLILINWQRFDVISQMRFEDFRRHFHAIWYPSSDDIEIFDDGLNWILSITHDGTISIARFG